MANRKGGKNAKKSKSIRAAYTEKAKKKNKKAGKKTTGKKTSVKQNKPKTQSTIKKTGNSRADQRREGAARARENTANKVRQGATAYTAKDIVSTGLSAVKGLTKTASTVPTKTTSSAIKNSQNRAGTQHKGGKVATTGGKSSGAVKRTETAKKQNQEVQAKVKENKAKHEKNGYEWGDSAVKSLDTATKKIDKGYDKTVGKALDTATKKIEKSKQKDLKYASEDFSDEKKYSVPFVGKVSGKDVVESGIKMGSAAVQYAIPYGATTKLSLKGAEKLLTKSTAKQMGKEVTEDVVAKAVAKSGNNLTPEQIAKLTKKINRKAKLKSVGYNTKKELLANAGQDLTVGTALDYTMAKKEGYSDDELLDYMTQSAVANLAIGAPISAIAGRAGAKELKNAVSKSSADELNKVTRFNSKDARELMTLEAKEGKVGLTDAEITKKAELATKASGAGGVEVNSKGKLVQRNSGDISDVLTQKEVKEYIDLKTRATSGARLSPENQGKLNALNTKVENARKILETNANNSLNGKVKSNDIDTLKQSAKFFERTGDTKKLKQTQKRLDEAVKLSKDKAESMVKTAEVLSKNTNIKFEVASPEAIAKAVGNNASADDVVKGVYLEQPDGTVKVMLNEQSPQAHQVVAGHESGHIIKSASSEDFDALGVMLSKYAKERGEYEDLVAKMSRSYVGESDEAFQEEVICEMIGRYIFGEDDTFIKQLAGEKPSILQQIADYIKGFLGKTTNKELREEYTRILDSIPEKLNGEVKSGANDFSYATLSAKKPRKIAEINKNVPLQKDGNIDRDKIVEIVKTDARNKNNPKNTSTTVFVKNLDQNEDIRIDTGGVRHGLGHKNTNVTSDTAIVEMALPDIIENSIMVNRLSPRGNALETQVFVGVARYGDDVYVARLRVDREAPSKFAISLDDVDIIYKITGSKSKKVPEPVGEFTGEPVLLSASDTKVSVPVLLELVNKTYPDALSDDVLKHFGTSKETVGKSYGKQENWTSQTLYSKEKKPTEDVGSFNAHREELLKDAEEYYGSKYTSDFNESGFIFPDGKLPKMGDYGQRSEDHNVVIGLYDDIGYDTHQAPKTAAMGRFLDEGNIRIMPERGLLEMSSKTEPTPAQYSAIRNYLAEHDSATIEFSDLEGKSVDSKDYPNGVNPTQVVNDIKRFYQEGKIGGSQVAMFRFSKESKEAKQFESSLAERLKNGEELDALFDDAYKYIKSKTPQSYTEDVTNIKELRDARKYMRETAIRITTTDETKGYSINHLLENVGYDLKAVGKKINLKKNSGISVEKAYKRLQEVDSTRFPDLDTEEDMLRKMCDVAIEDTRAKQTIEIPDKEYDEMIKQEASEMLERAFAKNQSAKKVEEGLANAKPVSKKAQEESIQTSTEGEKADILRDAKVSDKPVKDLSVEELNKEKTSLGFGIKNGKTPEHIELRKQRLAEVEGELASRKKPYDKSIYTAPASENLRENTRKAMDYGIDVSDRVNEFNELGDKYASLKKQRDASSNPAEKERLDTEMELAKVRQTNIAESIYIDLSDERLKVGKGEDFTPEYFDATAKGETSSALKDIGGAETLAGDMKKVSAKGAGSKKAQKLVAEEMKDYKSCLESYLKGDFAKDADMQNARATAILDNLAEKLKSNPEDADAMADLMRVVDKLSTNNSLPSNVINSANTLMNATPKGRIGVAVRAVNDLNKRYGDRIDGVLKLTDEEQVKLATTEPSEELDNLYKEITARLWEDIPASRLEKFNEIRHMFMLTNARTHARNLGGNFSFKQFRRIADNLEWIMQDKVFRNAIEKRGGEIDRVKVTAKEISEHKDYLKSEFETAYTKSNSVNRWIETNRPDGVPVVKMKALNALIQGDYKALEIEDMLTFKPAFNKSYMQYVKAKGWDIKNMTPPQQKMARERALFDAEYATFRDTSRFSTWLTGKKHTLASREGKTIWGTAFYRMGNMALEGLMPFVKTPVNIFRRSVDFSPISLVRSIGELASKDPEIFKQGIKHLSTGLTGTGVFGLGYYLSNAGFISIDTKTGEHSGSKYYDQDMGYQDYSLVIDIGGKKQSWSIDWLQPIEASLFMGAAFKDMVSDIKAGDGFGTDAIAALFAVTSPMLDASFMSSTKDMLETFEQRTARENDKGEPDMAGAFAQMLLGDLPKNYISSVVPQVVSQVANATDKYQRDTRSTLEDPILASWDKALKQMVNRIPVLRQKLLNPKIDRFGEDKVTGNNVAVRLLNSMFNPSSVKDITENKYDRELFKIRDNIDKGTDDYKYFFYNFTGNPVYELANDKRMTYDELYKYGKANRVKQTEIIQTMIDSKSYGGMTWDMKAKEVDDAHWVANTVADLKTYGVNYTLKALFNNGKQGKAEKGDFESYKAFKGNNKETKKAFLDYYIEKETMLARAHCDTADIYRIKAAIAIRKGDKELLSALDVYKSNIEDMTTYIKQMRKKAKSSGKALKDLIFDDITDFTCSAASYIDKAGVTSSTTTKSLALGLCAANGDKKSEITYRGMGYDWNKAQAGAGLALKYGVNGVKGVGALNELASLKAEIRRLDADGSGSYTKSDVTSYIDSNMSGASDDEKACMFESLSNGDWKNPYKAEINDHLKWKENRDESSGGGGGWGHGWGHGGGGGSSTAKGKTISQKSHKAPKVPKTKSSASVPSVHRTSVNPSAPNFSVTNPFGSSNTSTKSNLDDAYRKKLKKLLG